MDISSAGGSGSSNPKVQASAPIKVEAEQASQNAEQATKKEVRKADAADQKLEGHVSVQQQRVAPKSDAVRSEFDSKKSEKREARPQISDAISREITKEAVKKAPPPPKAETKAAPAQPPKQESKRAESEPPRESRESSRQKVELKKFQDDSNQKEASKSVSRDGVVKEEKVSF